MIYKYIGDILDLIFSSDNNLRIELALDSFVTPNKYHPPLCIV